MNKMAASNNALELAKSFIEHQVIASSKPQSSERGQGCAEFVVAFHKHLAAYFETVGKESE